MVKLNIPVGKEDAVITVLTENGFDVQYNGEEYILQS